MSNASLPPGASSPREHGRDDDRERRRARAPERGGGRGAGSDRRDDRDDERDGPDARRAAIGASSSTMALILHALTFLCCMNWLFGIAGIVFAVRAAHARDRGRAVQAETLTRYSWYCLGAAGVMLFVMLVLTLVMFTQAGSWVQGIVPVTNY
ncbi:hypothetical protein KGD83_04320 [Nocardiopsis akebiae]|uniref:DUF4190 domain-containing protein n=1 Tax=Nocardiopsis akebiae TaxID=2831968 RepID=A0ABX8C8G0_9ACTN|nr:hypothetical protein [Nocardiopsis akebiae]QUX29804.1 hypothetical protein KGD83_04320 [Nocardiopsis akebiae]